VTSASEIASQDSLPVQRQGCWADLLFALAIYWLSTNVVLIGALAGPYFMPFDDQHVSARQSPDLLAWDGKWYRQIAAQGYSYHSDRQSNVAFFPVYPVASSLFSGVTGLPVEVSLLLVSHGSLILALFILLRYLRLRFPEGPRRVWYFSLASAAFFPTTFFFRMAYSESTFLLLAVLTLYGIARRWPPIWVALIVGLATAARPVGGAVLLPFVAYLWRRRVRSRQCELQVRSLKSKVQSIVLFAFACWGILLYTAFLSSEFGDPLAWVKSQQMWGNRPDVGIVEKGIALAILEPLWSSYLPSAACYWNRPGQPEHAILSMRFWNPIYVCLAAFFLGIGIRTKWLNVYETLLGIGLLLIPYLTRGYEMCMESQGRFVAVVFPIYLVLGHLLARLPAPVAVAIVALSGFLMAVHAGMLAAGYIVI